MVKKLKTAFITGSEGFIGGYLSKVLLNKYQVIGGYYKKTK